MKDKKANFEIIIRSNASIKSRQWWKICYKKIKMNLLKLLPKSKVKLLTKNSLSLLVTKDKEIKKLNHLFRKKRKPTDVLSFHLSKNQQQEQKYLGDIVISVETAKRQAYTNGVSFENELKMLFIHAYLHLLGYDHIRIKDRKIMFSLQNKILDKCI